MILWMSCSSHPCCSTFLVSRDITVVVSAVTYQRQYRSCWAFSGTQAALSQLRGDTAWSLCSADTSCTHPLACTVAVVRRWLDCGCLRLPAPWRACLFLIGLRMPVDFVPTAPVNLHVSRLSEGVNWSVTEVLSAVTGQSHRGSCWTFSACQAVVRSWCWLRGIFVDLSRVARRPLVLWRRGRWGWLFFWSCAQAQGWVAMSTETWPHLNQLHYYGKLTDTCHESYVSHHNHRNNHQPTTINQPTSTTTP